MNYRPTRRDRRWFIEAGHGARFSPVGLEFIHLGDDERGELAGFVDEGTHRHPNV